MNSLPTLGNFIIQRTKVSRITTAAIVGLVAGLIVALSMVYLRKNSDQHLLRALSRQVVQLAGAQDIPELSRLLSGVSLERESQITVAKNSKILFSTETLSDIGKTSEDGLLTKRSSWDWLITTLSEKHSDIVVAMKTPLLPILRASAIVALFVGFGCALILYFLSLSFMKLVQNALDPVKDLELSIRDLKNLSAASVLSVKQPIQELEKIRRAIAETKLELEDANDKLAESKTTERLNLAYRQLIHDLHNPVVALSEFAKIADGNLSDADRSRVNDRIAELTRQILNQVTANKENLQNDIRAMLETDIRTSIAATVEMSQMAGDSGKSVKLSMPDHPVEIPHDSFAIQRAIGNLISNSLKAAQKNVQVDLIDSLGKVTIRVSDDGPGIPEDQVRLHLLGQGSSNTGDRPSLGLSSVNHITRTHGGRVVYRKSQLGGACFEIQL